MGHRHRDRGRDRVAIGGGLPFRRRQLALLAFLATTATACPPVPPGPSVGAMIAIPGAGFEIDVTEVTRAQYRLFEAAAVPLPTDEFCEWNASRVPGCAWEGAGDDDLPANCINWCNARDYCLWAGKRLCRDSWDDPKAADAEWLLACKGPEGRVYPYGDDYGSTTCNGVDYPKFPQARPVGSFPDCVGGWPRLYDMSGNVNEWVDACSPAMGALAACRLRGGSFQDPAGNLECEHDFGVHDSPTLDTNRVGFRCCRTVATGAGADAGAGTGG